MNTKKSLILTWILTSLCLSFSGPLCLAHGPICVDEAGNGRQYYCDGHGGVGGSSGNTRSNTNIYRPSAEDIERQRQYAEQERQQREAEERRREEAISRIERAQEQKLKFDRSDALQKLKALPPKVYLNSRLEDPFRTSSTVIAAEQSKLDSSDPVWIADIQSRVRAAIANNVGQTNQLYRSFRMNAPPKLPEQQLSASESGDIILVGRSPTLGGMAQGFVQRYFEAASGNKNTEVTHALLYLREEGGLKLFLDNQLGKGPQIIDENELKLRYGQRKLVRARPRQSVSGEKLWEAALNFAEKNAKYRADKAGLPGSNYGVLDEDTICSETALLAVIRAQSPGKKMVYEHIAGDLPLVIPGDIYNKRNEVFFTVQPLHID